MQVWKKSNADYVVSKENDFPALRSIAESLAVLMNIKNPMDFESITEIKKAFELIVKFVGIDPHFKTYQLSQIDKYFNAIVAKMKSEQEGKKAATTKPSIIETNLSAAKGARDILAKKYGQTNQSTQSN